ncbi:MAG TPA: hypothetical protein VGG29_03615 [Caulobacteraceae bacterium]|jgi:hypothetical protein
MPTQGLDSLSAKLARIPGSVQAAVKGADDHNATDFMQQVEARIPRAKPEDHEGARPEHLVQTLAKSDGPGPMAVTVSIGGPEAPYPMHLEGGHMAKNGRHVQGEPFWFPTLRINKRRFQSRRASAVRAALKALCIGGAR